MGREFELKYAATDETLESVRKKWEHWTRISMETTYFDTATGELSRKNCTLRRRMENGKSVCTLKTPAPGYGRQEWELEKDWGVETVKALFAKASLPEIPFEDLAVRCGARFVRLAKTVEIPGGTVEIALDQGVLLGKDREIPLCELEVEVKSGDETAACLWAEKLAETYDLKPERRSKFARASALAKGE